MTRTSSNQAAFTVIEILVVAVVLIAISTFLVPRLMVSTISANEAAVIKTLRALASRQLQTRNDGEIDSNRDGIGEYGFFQELSGVRGARIDTDSDGLADTEGLGKVMPPSLPGSFGIVDRDGLIRIKGYLLRMYLPGSNGEFLRERNPDEAYPPVCGVEASSYWACYAWPTDFDVTGRRVFFVNQEGKILAADNVETQYRGLIKIGGNPVPGPSGNAAYAERTGQMSAPIAVNTVGVDGNTWHTVQ